MTTQCHSHRKYIIFKFNPHIHIMYLHIEIFTWTEPAMFYTQQILHNVNTRQSPGLRVQIIECLQTKVFVILLRAQVKVDHSPTVHSLLLRMQP